MLKVFGKFKDARGGGRAVGRGDSLRTTFWPDGRGVEATFNRRPDQSFTFALDGVFPPGSSEDEVYEQCADFAVAGALGGQSGVILSYGPGGSGKFDTVFGGPAGEGLLLTSCAAIFEGGAGRALVSVVEVFKESFRDLLQPHLQGPLRLREMAAQTVVEGALEEQVSSAEEVAALLTACSGPIEACKGHCVVTVRLGNGAKLYFVSLADIDLGGTTSKGMAADTAEARKWSTKSFASLGGCLKAVSDRAKMVPVRDGALTRLLREALGQGSNVSVVGHCTLADDNAEETISTLRFVYRLVRQASSKQAGGKANGAPGKHLRGSSLEEADIRKTKLVQQNQPPAPDIKRSASEADYPSSNGEKGPDRVQSFPQRTLRSPSPVFESSPMGMGGGGGSHPIQDELARAWAYAFHLENLIVWIAEVFQVGGYDPLELEAMLLASCQQLQSAGTQAPLASVQHLMEMHGNEELELPGGQNHMVNFRKNPVGDSPWAGELHQVLLNNGVLRKLECTDSVALLSVPLTQLGDDLNKSQKMNPFDVPRVVTEDAKFLYLDGRINELEEKAAGATDLDKFDLHIESLRKDVEDSLDHIDDELFANLVSRVSYLKMRREWERENSKGTSAHANPFGSDHAPSQRHSQSTYSSTGSADTLLQELQTLKARGQLSSQQRQRSLRDLESKGESKDCELDRFGNGYASSEETAVEEVDANVEPPMGEGRKQEWSTASSEEVNAGKLLEMLRDSLKTHERRHQSKVYSKCFSGWQLVDWLVDRIDQENLTYVTKVWNCSIPPIAPGSKISREQASIIAQGLMNAQIFAHLGSAADFTDDETLYRLLDGEELTVVLNRQILWAGNARSAVQVSQELLKQAISLAHASGARDFASVQKFQQASCELQMVNLIQLPVEELRCFFINIFNVLVLHARVTSKAPQEEGHIVPRCSFFRNTSYQVGKYFYSLDDICRGILRAKKCLFLDCDPRVHFALSYGTRHTPPARVFHAPALDSELDAACRKFCSERVRADVDAGEVVLPLLFEWYRKDFASTPAGLLEWVSNFAPATVAHNLTVLSQRKDVRILFE